MKKTILAITLFAALAFSAYAGVNEADRKLLNDLSATLKSSTQVKWTSTDNYDKATFGFNGQTVSAFYDPTDGGLIGFSIRQNNLPKEITDAIQKKYSDWTVVDSLMFIDSHANVNYFAQVKKNKSNLALRISTNGKVSIFSKMPTE